MWRHLPAATGAYGFLLCEVTTTTYATFMKRMDWFYVTIMPQRFSPVLRW